MRAILLAAGCGTRLRPLTDSIPKCLVPINGRPLLDYWLQYLTEAGIGPLLVNVHYLPDLVSNFVKSSSFSLNVSIVYEAELLGTGGTLLRNRRFFDNEPVMLIHADNLCKCNLSDFIESHKNRPEHTEMTMMLFDTPSPSTCGIVELDEERVVQKFHEKVSNPPSNLANGAVYIVEPTVVDFVATLKKSVIDFSTEILPHYLGRINTWRNAIYHRDIGNMESWAAAQIEFNEIALQNKY